MVVSNNFQEDDDAYSSFVPFYASSSHRYKNKNYKNTILDIIFNIKNTDDEDSDDDNKGCQTSRFQARF